MSAEFEKVEGYDHENSYSDDMIFNIDSTNKEVSVIRSQKLIAGEMNSQFIAFQIPRYYDNIDLATKDIQILYLGPTSFSDINRAINVEKNDEFIRFGWLVPAGALLEAGDLAFCIEFTGENYMLKTSVVEMEVFDGLEGSEVVNEPIEQEWYAQLQNRCEEALAAANATKASADQTLSQTQASVLAVKKDAADIAAAKEKLNDIDVIKNQIASMQGTYTGSAEGELADARVLFDGRIAETVGEAIRTQIAELDEGLKYQSALGVISESSGKFIHIDDAADYRLLGLNVLGTSTQEKVPTATAPADIINVVNPTLVISRKNIVGKINLVKNTITSNPIFRVKLEAGRTYIARIMMGGKAGSEYNMRLSNDIDFGIYKSFAINKPFTPDIDYNYIWFNNWNKMDCEPMIEIGDVITDFEAFEGTKLQLPCTLRGIGTYRDQICEQNGQIGILRAIKEIDCSAFSYVDSESRWTYSASDSLAIGEQLSEALPVMCTIAKGVLTGTDANTCRSGALSNYNMKLIYVPKSTNLSGAKFMYPCEPTFEAFAPDVQAAYRSLKSYAGITNIFADQNTEIEVEYESSMQQYAERLKKEQQESVEKAVGDAIANIQGSAGMTENVKIALLNCFANVAWADANGQTYYDALANALNSGDSSGGDSSGGDSNPDPILVTLLSISAVYSGDEVDAGTDVNTLKSNIVVTANYSDDHSEIISSYTISGEITTGSNTLTISYSDKTTTITVTGKASLVNTQPVIVKENYGINTTGAAAAKDGLCITKTYPIVVPQATYEPRITYFIAKTSSVSSETPYNKIALYKNDALADYISISLNNATTKNVGTSSGPLDADGIAFTLYNNEADLSNSYAFLKTSGDIIFAGSNTQYYGKSNIND